MNTKLLSILLLSNSLLFGACLSNEELINMPSDELQNSYIDCKNSNTKFEQAICNNKDLSMLFAYYSKVHAEFWMRNLNMAYNYKKSKNEDMKFWTSQYNFDHLDNICFDIKKRTEDMQGGISPYKIASIHNSHDLEYYIQENKHGAVLTNRDGGKIYLGQNCDVINDKQEKGLWYKKNGYYILTINKTSVQLNVNQDLTLKNLNCSEEKIKKLMSK